VNGLIAVPLVLLAAVGLASALGSHMKSKELETRLERALEEAGFWQQLATDLEREFTNRGW
jgi:hypothetical protein